jgi:hypothetical protein
MDRREINRALAKALAYAQCGKKQEAAAWAARLVSLLECTDILTDRAHTAAHTLALREG